ncbi:hypothetical protein RB594_008106 [Gaeumannomyces avenae]
MSDHNDASPTGIDDLTPEEASRIIHSHRKVRYGTACWPCRQRKVKCDNKQPCENCVKRDHAQLCSYKPNRSGARGSMASDTASSTTQGKKREHSPGEDDARHKAQDIRTESSSEITAAYAEPENSEVSRYLGQNSIPAILREQLPQNGQQEEVIHIRQEMRSILGLDTSAPFPLMSRRHLDRMTMEIVSELPSDREVMKLFRTYKEIPQQFWGFVIDISELESRLMIYLEDRAKNAKSSNKTTKQVSASWLAILFAILAVGSQYHESPYHVRTANSQKYIQISFHFLRISNFLLRPNFDSIQAMLMTSFVLLNDMKAEASWALLGLTCRLAQSLGLDKHPHLDGKEPPEILQKETVRRKLWWKCVWHDSLTSLSFDRSPMTNAGASPIPIANPDPGNWEYLEGMYHLCKIISQRLNPEALAAATYEDILENCQTTEAIRDKMKPQLRSKEACKSALDRLHYFAIRLHTSFIVSVCCRPALHRGTSTHDSSGSSTSTSGNNSHGPGHSGGTSLSGSQKRKLADKCKRNLTETVRMFLAMHQLSVIPTRSWAFTYHGLSSAVLLGILGETKADPEVRQLQGDLISALSATAAKEATSPAANITPSDKDIELSGPLSRALMALRNIYDHGSITGNGAGLRKELASSGYASGARTPLKFGVPAPQPAGGSGQDPQQQLLNSVSTTLDPHQDAALAMATMQNGNGLSEFSNSMTFVPQMQDGIIDPAVIDPSTYMSPMDVYDQIFWESPDPWNTGMDSMNFDFLAQPPPENDPR